MAYLDEQENKEDQYIIFLDAASDSDEKVLK